MADVAIVVFPGSNCDRDIFHVFSHHLRRSVVYHWHDQPLKKEYKLVVLPGGFSYGDYLRAGAIARFTTVMESLGDYLSSGGKVIGICNGFQILVEAKLLPGLLQKNASLQFQCEDVFVRLEAATSPMLSHGKTGEVFRMPIAHSEGRYVVSEKDLKELEENHQIVLRYCNREGRTSDADFNANGSVSSIAGVSNREGNVIGFMPHPERSADMLLGSADGLRFLSVVDQSL